MYTRTQPYTPSFGSAILEMRKPRLKEAKKFVQDYPAKKYSRMTNHTQVCLIIDHMIFTKKPH